LARLAELQTQRLIARQQYGCTIPVCPTGGKEKILIAGLQRYDLEPIIAEPVGTLFLERLALASSAFSR
jgi:hypothetical protein